MNRRKINRTRRSIVFILYRISYPWGAVVLFWFTIYYLLRLLGR